MLDDIVFDNNAIFRHEGIPARRDPDEEQPLEVQAVEMGATTTSSWTATSAAY